MTNEFPEIEPDRYYTAALEWVNQQRKLHAQKPLERLPVGVAAAPCCCVLGRATGYLFCDDGTYSQTGSRPATHELPADVAEFEHRVERGSYPALVAAVFRDPTTLGDAGLEVPCLEDYATMKTSFPVLR